MLYVFVDFTAVFRPVTIQALSVRNNIPLVEVGIFSLTTNMSPCFIDTMFSVDWVWILVRIIYK